MAIETLNHMIYQRHIKNNPNLGAIEYDNDCLYLANPTFKKVVFTSTNDLSSIPTECFNIKSPEIFLDVIELNLKTELEYDFFKAKDIELEKKSGKEIFTLYFMPIRNILNKQEINKQDIIDIRNFFEEYNKLILYNGYLSENALNKLKEMSSILNWTLKAENYIENNYAQQLLRQYINKLNNNEYATFNQIESDDLGNNSQTNEKGLARMRINPLFPSSSCDEEPIFQSKTGFLSFAALIYIIFNILVMLVTIAIK
ncbi:MAG: hypothetical protein IJO33_03640 [Bacilli bacterium]|nr:hypothetical protein [Bacilli bacterium]